MKQKFILLNILINSALFVGLTFRYGLPWYESVSLALTFYYLLNFIFVLGKKLALLDVIILLALVQWLAASVISYEIFNRYNKLANLWGTFMSLPAADYFSYVLPGTIMLIIGLKFPTLWHSPPNHQQLIQNVKLYLHDKGHIGLWMCGIGLSTIFFVPFLPEVIRAIFYLFAQLLYVGLFYVLFSSYRRKSLILLTVLSITLIQSIMGGMYGDLVFWSLLFTIVYLMEHRVSMISKLAIISLSIMMVFLLQSIKHEYRDRTWAKGHIRNSDFSYFFELVGSRISDPATIFERERVFNMAIRANQGFWINNVLTYVPKHEPFANGETLLTSAAAAVVPRIFWPDKPRTGGQDNMVRFLGLPEGLESSFGLSPIGESYANFGRTGGIIFMFFYGFLFNFIFHQCLRTAQKYPSFVLWLPLLFVSSLTVETDFLSTTGILIKTLMFAWFIYTFSRIVLRIRI